MSERRPSDPGRGPLPYPSDETGRAVLRRWLDYLDDAIHRIGGSLDLHGTARGLTDVAVPHLADVCSVYLLNSVANGGGVRPVAGPAPGGATTLRRLARRQGAVPGRWSHLFDVGDAILVRSASPIHQAMTTGKPVLVNHIDPDAQEMDWTIGDRQDQEEVVAYLRGRSVLVTPLRGRGHTLGALVLVRGPDRAPFDEIDVRTADLLASQAGLGVDNADMYLAQATTADTLQRSMLPTELPDLTGVRIEHRYLPATPMIQVGGDWYDVIPLPGSRAALVVGDVMGHGIKSATIMGQFRTAVRTLSALDLSPDQVLRHLDDLAQSLGEGHIATCLYAIYDPVSRRLTAADAGHLPPMSLRKGECRQLDIPVGPPIGVGGAFEAVELPVADDDILVLFTDGLVENRDEDIDTSLAKLRESLSVADLPLKERCDRLLGSLDTAHRNDDVAVLMAHLHGIDAENVAQWPFQPRPATAKYARRLVRATLDEWGLSESRDIVELLVTELVTNAIRYATRPIEVRLLRTDALLCEVTDDDYHLPVLRHSDDQDENGRGLLLVSRLARRWGASRTATGKVVWFELPLPGLG